MSAVPHDGASSQWSDRVARPGLIMGLLVLASAVAACDFSAFFGPPTELPSYPESFIDATDRLGPAGKVDGWGGLAAFDYDNDGDIDLLVSNGPDTPNRLFQNDGHANFTEVGEQAGVVLPGDNCMACAVGDFNNDGRLDVLLGRQRLDVPEEAIVGPVMLINDGPNADGVVTFSQLCADQTGLASAAPSCALGVGDLDNDGLLDVLVGRYDMTATGYLLVPIYPSQPNELWRCIGVSGGVPQYERVMDAGIEGTEQNGFSPETADQTFIPGTLAVHLTDVDEDGLLDVFDLHDIPGGVDYFHNDGGLTFSRRQVEELNLHGGWMGMTGGDYDSDGDIDYFLTNVGSDFTTFFAPNSVAAAHLEPDATYFHRLLRNDGGVLTDVAAQTAVTPSTVLPAGNGLGGQGLQGLEFGFGTTWIDANNAGRPDLYWVGDLISYIRPGLAANWHGVGRFLANNGDGSFVDRTAERKLFDIPAGAPIAFGWQQAGRAAAACDLNGDGFQDLVVTNASLFGTPDAQTRVFLNPAYTEGHWLTVRLVGTESNRFGIGARVRATAGGRTHVAEVLTTTSSFLGLHPQAHFGLGAAEIVDTLEVRWPSGRVTTVSNVVVDRVLTVEEM